MNKLVIVSIFQYPMFRALSLNKPEAGYLFIGLIGAVSVGVVEPLFGLVYSEMFTVCYRNNFYDYNDTFSTDNDVLE